MKGECITELANIVNCNIVETSECLGHHRDKGEALSVAILSHPPDLPIVGKSQGEARLFSFSCNSSVLERVDDGHIQRCVKARMPVWDR